MKKLFHVLLLFVCFLSVISPGIAPAEEITVSAPAPEFETAEGSLSAKEAFEGYILQAFGQAPSHHVLLKATRPLSGANKILYDHLVEIVKDVAAGKRSSALCRIPMSEFGIKTSYTLAELGYDELVDEAWSAFRARVEEELALNLPLIGNKLRADFPYEMYWASSYRIISGGLPSLSSDGHRIFFKDDAAFEYPIYVSAAYSVSGEDRTTEFDTSQAEMVQQAAANAKAIVTRYANASSDYGKLRGYKNAICALVDYNHDAADNDDTPYGNPWQLVWVFDGDSSTKVVCEGYSKAFKYLCDMSSFAGDTSASSVTGWMSGGTGAGAHMWNIVSMNGVNYLVDVTNCDDDADGRISVGYPDELFMAGYSDTSVTSDGTWYVYMAGQTGVLYLYDDDIANLYAAEDIDITTAGFEAIPYILSSAEEIRLGESITLTMSVPGVDENTFAIFYEQNGIDREIESITPSFQQNELSLVFTPDSAGEYVFYAGYYDAGRKQLTDASVRVTVTADETPANACGPNLTWSFENGTLTISGTGEMDEFEDGRTPWGLAGLCSQITALNLEEGVTRLTTFAFEYCAMSEVSIPDSVLTIDPECFLECPNLNRVSIPASTASIDPTAFYLTLKLREIIVDSANTYYAVKDGMLMNKAATEIVLIPSALETVVIPESITHLPESAFYAGHFTSVTVHAGIDNLNESAFMDAVIQNLTLSSGFETIQTNTFYGSRIGNLFLPATLTAVQANAFTEASLSHVWFDGSREAFDAVAAAEEGNAAFLNAEKHFLVITAEITEVPELIDLDQEGAAYTFSYALEGGAAPYALQYAVESFDSDGSSLGSEEFSAEDLSAEGTLALAGIDESAASVRVRIVSVQGASGQSVQPAESGPITVKKAAAAPRLDMTYSVGGEVLQPGDSFACDKTLTVDWTLSHVPEGWELVNETQMRYRSNQASGWTRDGDWLDKNTVLTGGAGHGRFTITPKTADSLLVVIYLYDPETKTFETLCEDDFTLTGCTLEPLKVTVSCSADSIQRSGRLADGTEIPRTATVHYQVTGGSGNYTVSSENGEKISGISWYWLTDEGFDEDLPSGVLGGPEGDLVLTAPENITGPVWLSIDVEDEEAGLFLLGDHLLELQITDYVPIQSEITQIPEQIIQGQDGDAAAFSYAIDGGTAPYTLHCEAESYDSDGASLGCTGADAENLPASGTLALPEVHADAASVRIRIYRILDAEGQGIEPAESAAIPVTESEIATIDVSALTKFSLPEGLTEIGKEAFSGISAEYILCQSSLTAIGEKAFAGCENLICVSLPDSLGAGSIAPDAFPEGVIFLCEEGSPAWKWAEANHLKRMAR